MAGLYVHPVDGSTGTYSYESIAECRIKGGGRGKWLPEGGANSTVMVRGAYTEHCEVRMDREPCELSLGPLGGLWCPDEAQSEAQAEAAQAAADFNN